MRKWFVICVSLVFPFKSLPVTVNSMTKLFKSFTSFSYIVFWHSIGDVIYLKWEMPRSKAVLDTASLVLSLVF